MSQPGPKVKRSRALGIPLTPKAATYMEKRPYPPGPHGRSRAGKASDYKIRLMEKQRLREQYNVSERQMRRAFGEATRKAGKTGEILVSLLERRLDAFVLRSGFARTIYQARQFVSHRHFLVNGQRVNIPSYRLKPGDFVHVAPASRSKPPFMYASTGGGQVTGKHPPISNRTLRDSLRDWLTFRSVKISQCCVMNSSLLSTTHANSLLLLVTIGQVTHGQVGFRNGIPTGCYLCCTHSILCTSLLGDGGSMNC